MKINPISAYQDKIGKLHLESNGNAKPIIQALTAISFLALAFSVIGQFNGVYNIFTSAGLYGGFATLGLFSLYHCFIIDNAEKRYLLARA